MKPTTTTRVPAALDQLKALLSDDSELAGVRIYLGPPIYRPDARDVVVIAPSTADAPGATVSYSQQPGLGASYIETAEILMTISCETGDDDDAAIEGRRDRVMTIFGRLQVLLAENQVVDGAWDEVGLGSQAEWYFIPSDSGTTVALGFFVVARSVV